MAAFHPFSGSDLWSLRRADCRGYATDVGPERGTAQRRDTVVVLDPELIIGVTSRGAERRGTSRKGNGTMKKLMTLVQREEGQDMVEYALLAALITVVAITAITLVGDQVVEVFGKISAALSTS
jgi:pilus assembly protein Flp/PilA